MFLKNVYLTDDIIFNFNIAFGVGKDKFKKKKVEEALKKAQLKEFVSTLTSKENTQQAKRSQTIWWTSSKNSNCKSFISKSQYISFR